MWYDIGMILIFPAAIMAMVAQWRVNSAYRKWAEVDNANGVTGAETARRILDAADLADVPVERIPGHLTDHYDPRDRALRLSAEVYDGASIAAVGIAAHETGHAIQHEAGYSPLIVRNSILPVANLGSKAAFPLILLGLLFSTAVGSVAVNIGLMLFTAVVAFQIITLPVELDASGRAMALIEDGGFLNEEEAVGARKVLTAAAWTYIAAAAVAVANLLRMVLMSGRRR